MLIICEKGGFINKINTEDIGNANVLLGGGRIKKEDSIDMTAGIILNYKVGKNLSERLEKDATEIENYNSGEIYFNGELLASDNPKNKEKIGY